MLFRCNILALVGGGQHPLYPTNKVMLWDDHQQKCIGELTFKDNVHGVKLRRDKVIVVLEKKIYIYNFTNLSLIDQIETSSNLCSVSYDDAECVLACCDKEKGRVKVNIYQKDQQEISNVIEAHNSSLSCIALNFQGTLLATASEKGTIIRLYNPQTGDLLQELRRGSDKAEVYSIAIDFNTKWLGCTSDKGTVHIFSIAQLGLSKDEDQKEQKGNNKHALSKIFKKFNKYFDSEWSFAKFRVTDSRTLCTFDKNENLVVVSTDGTYYRANIDQQGGECELLQEKRILNESD